MYWKILVTHPPRSKHEGYGITSVHVGPFRSEKEMEAFRNYWEKEDILEKGEKITFTLVKKPPKEGALAPKDFHGIERWKIVE